MCDFNTHVCRVNFYICKIYIHQDLHVLLIDIDNSKM